MATNVTAQPCSVDSLDFTDAAAAQQVIEGSQMIEIPAVTPLPAETNVLEFRLNKSPQAALLFDTFLHLRVSVTNENGTPLDDKSVVGPINMFLYGLIRSLDLWVNGEKITEPNEAYGYVAYILATCWYSSSSKKYLLGPALYERDTPGNMDNWDTNAKGPLCQ